MPLNKTCSLEALRENIAAEITSGTARDQAVAIAFSTLRRACAEEDKPVPSQKETSGVTREFKRKRGERGPDYMEAALEEARRSLSHRSFAMLHQAARSRAGGRATARTRVSTVEKALLLGPSSLTDLEMTDAWDRAHEIAAAETRRGVELGGLGLIRMVEAEEARRAVAKAAVPVEKKSVLGHIADVAAKIEKTDRSADPGVMVAMRLPKNTASAIALDKGEPSDRLHVTLAYLGRMSKLGPEGILQARLAMEELTSNPPIKGVLCGVGRFAGTESSDGKDVIYAPADCPGLSSFRAKVVESLKRRGLPVNEAHDYTPHVTLAYVSPDASTPRMGDALRLRDVYFDSFVLAVNDVDTPFMLGQPDMLEQARFAAIAQQVREASAASVMPSAPVMVTMSEDGRAEVETSDGERLVVACSVDVEPGDVVEVGADMDGDPIVESHSASALPASTEVVEKAIEASRDRKAYGTRVPFVGAEDARVVFVAAAPSALDVARGEPLVGADGVAFAEAYLGPLRLTKSQVAIGYAHPTLPRPGSAGLREIEDPKWLNEQLARWPKATIVALGPVAKALLGERATLALPHPASLRIPGKDSFAEEARRKVRKLADALDSDSGAVQDARHRDSEPHGSAPGTLAAVGGLQAAGQIRVRISKAADEKQIVYGVVLDPYAIDTQGEWVPPAEIESTAHGFVKKSRVIGVEHKRKANAQLVESFVMPYPTAKDYRAAMQNLPHQAYEMPFGEDKVRSGTWVAGVELGAEEWAAYQRGEITGFSIGGFSFKTRVSIAAMPAVEFLKLAPVL